MLSGLDEADPWWTGSEFDCDGAHLIRIAFYGAMPYWEQHEMLCVGVYIQRRHDQIISTLMDNGHWPWTQHKEMALNEFEEFVLRVFWGFGPTTTIHPYGPEFLYRLICELERRRQEEEREGQRCLHL